MKYSARKAINCRAKNVPHDIKEALEERFARAVIDQGGDRTVQIYQNTHADGLCGQWGLLELRAKGELTGHFDAEIIHAAKFEVG